MTRRIKSKKQLDREREIEREEKKKEFEALYYVQRKVWKESGLDMWYEFDSLEEFVAKKMDGWESRQLKIPSGKYQDEERIISNYQQKFAEYVKQLCPEIFDELREFVPYFDNILGEQKDKYLDIFSSYKNEIFDLDCILQNKINYSVIKDSFLKFRPNYQQNWRFDYQWGEYRILLHFFYLFFVGGESIEKSSEISAITFQLLQDNLMIERDQLNLPDDFDELILKNYVISQSIKIIQEIFFSSEQKIFREEAKQKLIKFLEHTSPTPETSIADFVKLQVELLKWAEKHNLKKDWILRYAYFFLFQFSNDPNIKLSEIEILYLDIRSLYAEPFEFTFNGWSATDEEKEDYEKRITESFAAELKLYFHNVSRILDLDSIKRITKPIDYNSVKPLVRRTVQKWSFEKIVEIDYEILDTISTKKSFARKVKYLKEELTKLKKFDLPFEN